MKHKKPFIYTMFALLAVAIILLVACSLLGITKSNGKYDIVIEDDSILNRLIFNADSAYFYCEQQCSFGPRVPNTEAHNLCGEWIKEKFSSFGLTVESQRADLKAYNGTTLKAENIIARLNPDAQSRLLLCAHWDSRPWADNDPNPDNQRTPVLAANDGASGVAVLLELARMLTADSVGVNIGIDFICFDAEDYGIPQWADYSSGTSDTWALGSRYWSERYAESKNKDVKYEFGILFDMVGGEGSRFYKERLSSRYASDVVDKVWKVAQRIGYSAYFPQTVGQYVIDDHTPINRVAHIQCADIIAYFPDCPQSSFGPTWHTLDDNMEHLSRPILQVVGQTIASLLAEY